MSGISSVSSGTSSTYYSPLDTNKDGVVDAQELQAGAKSGLLSASVTSDESGDSSDDSSGSSASDSFSGNLIEMILEQMQQAARLLDIGQHLLGRLHFRLKQHCQHFQH